MVVTVSVAAATPLLLLLLPLALSSAVCRLRAPLADAPNATLMTQAPCDTVCAPLRGECLRHATQTEQTMYICSYVYMFTCLFQGGLCTALTRPMPRAARRQGLPPQHMGKNNMVCRLHSAEGKKAASADATWEKAASADASPHGKNSSGHWRATAYLRWLVASPHA